MILFVVFSFATAFLSGSDGKKLPGSPVLAGPGEDGNHSTLSSESVGGYRRTTLLVVVEPSLKVVTTMFTPLKGLSLLTPWALM